MEPTTSSSKSKSMNLVERQRYLFLNIGSKFSSDIQFYFKNEEVTLYANKNILSSASCVFEAMFYGSLAGKDNESIEVVDIYSDIYRELLRYIYTDEVNLLDYNVCQVLYAGHKYQIVSLEERCTAYMKANLNTKNALKFYESGNLLEITDSHFYGQLQQFIDWNMMEFCASGDLFDLDLNQFLNLTKRDSLCVNELTLFNVAYEWSIRTCEKQLIPPIASNRRSVFEGFKSIRFPIMTKLEFDLCSSFILALELMNLEEMQKIKRFIQHHIADDDLGFSICERHELGIVLSKPYQLVVGGKYPLFYLKSEHCITLDFHVTKDTNILGFEASYHCRMKIIEKSGQIVSELSQHVHSLYHRSASSVVLKPDRKYVLEIIAERDGIAKGNIATNYDTGPIVFATKFQENHPIKKIIFI